MTDCRYAAALHNLAESLDKAGELPEAEELLRAALAIRTDVCGPEHPHTAYTLNSLAGLLSRQGLVDEARPLTERSLKIFAQEVVGAVKVRDLDSGAEFPLSRAEQELRQSRATEPIELHEEGEILATMTVRNLDTGGDR